MSGSLHSLKVFRGMKHFILCALTALCKGTFFTASTPYFLPPGLGTVHGTQWMTNKCLLDSNETKHLCHVTLTISQSDSIKNLLLDLVL